MPGALEDEGVCVPVDGALQLVVCSGPRAR